MEQRKSTGRIIALFMAVMMITALIPVHALAYADNGGFIQAEEEFLPLPFITESEVTAFSASGDAFRLIISSHVISTPDALNGAEIEVTVSIEDNTGFAAMPLQIDFPSALTLLKFDVGSNFQDAVFESTQGVDMGATIPSGLITDRINFAWARATNFTANGTLLTLTFFVDENTPVGTYPITASFAAENGAANLIDADKNVLTAEIVPGSIEVTPPPEPFRFCGDVSGNGYIEEFDVVLIVRYILGHTGLDTLPQTTAPISEFGFDIDYGKVTAESQLTDTISLADAVTILQYLAGHNVDICFCNLCADNMPVSVTTVFVENDRTMVRMNDGSFWAWGAHNGSHSPIEIVKDNRNISSSGTHSMEIRSDGTLWAWGNNQFGQLGDGTNINRSNPVPINGIDNVMAVYAVDNHTFAIKNDGSLWAWGDNTNGRLGDTTTTDRNVPVEILDDVKAVYPVGAHTIALKNDHTVWAWGNNNFGQLGNGSTVAKHEPEYITDDVATVYARSEHTMVIKNNGSFWVWGHNNNVQLGIGTSPSVSSSPVRIADLDNVVSVSFAERHTLALKNDNTLWVWGRNNLGQIGNNLTSDRFTPLQIMTDVSAVSVGSNHTVALKTDGTLWAWGNNVDGQLGNGSTTLSRVPVEITDDVKAVYAVGNHTFAVKNNGSLWAWGNNQHGQLGDDTTTNQLDPVLITFD